MAYNEKLAERVRKALAHLTDVEEKRMFGGIAFMVNGKMCVTVNKDRIMCRIDPDIHEHIVHSVGVTPMMMRGKVYAGYFQIAEDAIRSKQSFDHWIKMALSYNKIAKASKKKREP